MDKLRIHKITAYGYHGALPEETKLGQEFRVSLTLSLDLAPAGHSDDLEQTVNYAPIIESVTGILTGPPVKLIETLAETIASHILSDYPQVCEIEVEVEKPRPPVNARFSGVSVCIHRKSPSLK